MTETDRTRGLAARSWVDDVLGFWFADVGAAHWFTCDDELDARIRDRYLPLHNELMRDHACDDLQGARSVLAAIIVLDQFSRNMFRGTSRAFAADAIALGLANRAIALGLDTAMASEERLFIYLPLQHSEDRADQVRSVKLAAGLGNEEWARYAEAHRSIIDRFGRYPHRNDALGRVSTTEELAFLQQPGSGF